LGQLNFNPQRTTIRTNARHGIRKPRPNLASHPLYTRRALAGTRFPDARATMETHRTLHECECRHTRGTVTANLPNLTLLI
jgi:hypothetical protein